MESIGLFEAKTHFSALLERVANGETIEITRRGRRPVALLTPPERPAQRDLRKVVEEIKKIRVRNRLGPGLTIRQLIDEGRRF
jgi:prevent-host-death family protein